MAAAAPAIRTAAMQATRKARIVITSQCRSPILPQALVGKRERTARTIPQATTASGAEQKRPPTPDDFMTLRDSCRFSALQHADHAAIVHVNDQHLARRSHEAGTPEAGKFVSKRRRHGRDLGLG